MGWKKVVIGGALLTAGFFTMFEMLIMDETNLKGLDETDAAFVAYLTLYNKQYLSIDDYKFRKQWFGKTVDIIASQNLFNQGFVLGLNHMSDWTDEEYKNMLGLLEDREFPQQIIPHKHSEMEHNANFDSKYPDRPYRVDVDQRLFSVADAGSSDTGTKAEDGQEQQRGVLEETGGEWNVGDLIKQKLKEHGIKLSRPDLHQFGIYKESSWHRRNDGKPSIITKAKDQGRNCSASYAFAVVAALEAAQALEEGREPVSLSEQQVVDCTFEGEHRNFGCLGGSLSSTTKYVTKKPVLTSKAYPYINGQNPRCHDEDERPGGLSHSFSSEFIQIEPKRHMALMNALDKGPVVASIRAGSDVFRHFSDGVIDSDNCTAKAPGQKADHAVLVVGSGKTASGHPYFVIKNSFSKSWGDRGFARIAAVSMISEEGVCGILTSLWQPVFKVPDQ